MKVGFLAVGIGATLEPEMPRAVVVAAERLGAGGAPFRPVVGRILGDPV